MLIALIAGIVTFILTIIGIPAFIRFYHKARITGQQMHEDVKQHQAKAGTPTMGGTVFLLISVAMPSSCSRRWSSWGRGRGMEEA